MKHKYTLQDAKNAARPAERDGTPISVLFIEIFAKRLTLLIANYTNFSPNTVTYIHLFFYLLAALCFFNGTTAFIMLGAMLYMTSTVLDYSDGKLARLTSRTSIKGKALDVFIDTIGKGILVISLTYGLFRTTGNVIYILVGLVILFIYLFPPELHKIKVFYTEGTSLVIGLTGTEKNTGNPKPNLMNKLHIDRLFRYLMKKGIRPYPTDTDADIFIYFFCPIIRFLGIASILHIETILFGLILYILRYSIEIPIFTYLVFKNIKER